MRNLKLVIEYDGTRYNGWQRLGSTGKSIQGKIEEVLSRMTGEAVEIIGSGRTDAGVHAFGQVANFKTSSSLEPDQILAYLNTYLPEDIVVKKVEEADERFHSRYHAKGKRYLYRVWNHPVPTALERKYSYHFPEPLDLEAMGQGAALLRGTYDFQGFSTGKSKKSTVRNLRRVEITRRGEMVELVFEGDGFLYNMVRIMVGTLLEIGAGRMKPEQIPVILKARDRAMAGPTAPPQGLFLVAVEY